MPTFHNDFTHGLDPAKFDLDPHADAGFIAATQNMWDGASPDLDGLEQRDAAEAEQMALAEAKYQREFIEAQRLVSKHFVIDLASACSDELHLAMQQFDRGEIGLDRLGLLLVNVRNACAEQHLEIDGAHECQVAAAIALLGVAI